MEIYHYLQNLRLPDKVAAQKKIKNKISARLYISYISLTGKYLKRTKIQNTKRFSKMQCLPTPAGRNESPPSDPPPCGRHVQKGLSKKKKVIKEKLRGFKKIIAISKSLFIF